MNISKRKVSQDPVLHRIMDLLKEQRKTQKELTDYLELHPNTFNNWKFQNTKSYLKYLDQIADYLNVTPGYLIRGNSMGADVQNFSPLETKIINNISCLTINQQKILLNLIEEFKFANNPLR